MWNDLGAPVVSMEPVRRMRILAIATEIRVAMEN
jgi:hypothetical protein